MENDQHLTSLFLETDLALHEHCRTCVLLNDRCVRAAPHQRLGCRVIGCPHECGRRFHSCKTEEHLLLCELVKTPCINADYGCPLWIPRRDRGVHLATCPASVVYCNMERNRKPLTEYGTKTLKDVRGRVDSDKYLEEALMSTDLSRNPPDYLCNALDVALAYSDQGQINSLYRMTRAQRKAATNFFNKRHPAVPLVDKESSNVALTRDYNAEREEDSSEDEAAAKKRNASAMSPVARECILCKIDPSSQHLHQLRGMSVAVALNVELDENANESQKRADKWRVKTQQDRCFYADRGLRLDLSSDFLPSHYSKNGDYFTVVCDESLRRDEYARHFANVHNDIVDGLDGWALVRCPLWLRGCGCYATRLSPADGRRRVVYNAWSDAFAVRYDACEPEHQQRTAVGDFGGKGENLNFSTLPFDVLCHVCAMLDAGSMFRLAATCKALNEFVRGTFLVQRGIVERRWLKTGRMTAHGRTRWTRGAERWRFSKCFESVQKWKVDSVGRLVDHIKRCQYYEPLVHTEEKIPVLTFVQPFERRPSRRVSQRLDSENEEDFAIPL